MEEVGGGVRLHVGGLGESVGKDDLLKIFSPMGTVDSVEFVRTKGRSFAYIDFSPSSDKSLTKLFSTYNGCVWKGGKLRLEKAKEHYLARLKREWEEQSSPSVDTSKAPEDSTPSTHLNIFFPKLRKVKAMPLSGTGKHKYSFQRVVLPSNLPKTFCDCEEHTTSLTPSENHVHDLEALNVGINEEEVNIMNSVMTKLFQKNNIPNSEQVRKEEKVPEKEQVPEEDNEIEADQDNLVINVVSRGNNMRNSELDIMLKKRKSVLNETPAKAEGDNEGLKGNNIHPSKKRKSIVQEGSERQEPSQVIREKKKPSKVDLDKKTDEPSRTTDVKQFNDSISWSQKSSWKALVANGNTSNFSVSSFLPGASSNEVVQPSSPSTDLDESPTSSKDLDVPSSMMKTKIKKTKNKHLTSTVIADEIESSDTTASADGSDHSEDSFTDTSVEEPLDLVASSDSDSDNTAGADASSDHPEDSVTDTNVEEPMEIVASSENDRDNTAGADVSSDHSEGSATESVEESLELEASSDSDIDSDSDNTAGADASSDHPEDSISSGHPEDSVTDTSVKKPMEIVASSESDRDNTADADVSSDHSEDSATDSVEEPLELVASSESDSENDNMDVENEESVAEHLNAEKGSEVLKDNVDQDVDEKEAGKGQLEACSKPTGGSTWAQRAPWTQLVSEKSTSFSLTELFPDLNSDKPEAARVINNGEGQSSNPNQSENGMKQSPSTGDFEVAKVDVYTTPARSLEQNQQTLKVKNVSEGRLGVKKPPIRRNIGSSETCTFMRSETSLREWAKAKKALSEPRKRKKTED